MSICGRGPFSCGTLLRKMSSVAMSVNPMPVPLVQYIPHVQENIPIIDNASHVGEGIPMEHVPSVNEISRKSSVDAEEFTQMSPIERIQAIFEIHGDKAAQLASMQKTSGVVMHLIHTARVPMPILFFDTQYLFQETIDLKDEFAKRYNLNIVTVTPQLTPKQQDRLYGRDLWKTRAGQVQCCYMRKEQPLLQTIENMDLQATLSGLMQKEGGARSSVKPVDTDPRTDTVVYNPLFDWSNKDIHEYTKKHNLPVHKLYAKNFLSIGCAPCTTPVKPGEHARAGRWRHLRNDSSLDDQAYCGMNHTDVGNTEKPGLGQANNGLYMGIKKTSYLGLKRKH